MKHQSQPFERGERGYLALQSAGLFFAFEYGVESTYARRARPRRHKRTVDLVLALSPRTYTRARGCSLLRPCKILQALTLILRHACLPRRACFL
jgi:hypothetical protein